LPRVLRWCALRRSDKGRARRRADACCKGLPCRQVLTLAVNVETDPDRYERIDGVSAKRKNHHAEKNHYAEIRPEDLNEGHQPSGPCIEIDASEESASIRPTLQTGRSHRAGVGHAGGACIGPERSGRVTQIGSASSPTVLRRTACRGPACARRVCSHAGRQRGCHHEVLHAVQVI
jgi:hypothetical protein